jgi:enoyl-CoA hydratase/carnithine racemase
MGGGLGLVVACDLAVASDAAVFATPEIKVGLWPMMIMATVFRNVGRKAGLRMMLTGEKIPAEEARRIGLVSEVVPAGRLDERTDELARSLASRSPVVTRLGLEAFHALEDATLEEELRTLERKLFAVLATEDAREGMMAFVQKREPRFVGR